ncbi:hypothetical protein [Nocardioides currus]|uniref:Bacterial Ig domain-containing protein n=1 Tax=Nocardioides currus TaxID=2133958 RepID=A0A2R7Z121_9ACTN|nr:hypothetical protein [Nocardioides currus]PUA82328.1 hypothetical protein C7S10_00820 [Nocardioides currus]
MRFNRIIAGTVTAGLVGLVPVAVSSPASATDNLTTVTTVSSYTEVPITYGDTITLSSDVAASDGGSAYKGVVALQASTDGVNFATVATGENSYSSFEVKPTANTLYKVVYSGYTATSTYEDNYAPSESAPFAVTVKRKAVFKTPGLFLVGKIKPDFGGKKVILKKKKGKKYVAWKKVKTNKKGAFRVKAPNKSGFKFTVTIPGDAKFVGFTEAYQVY